MNFQKKSLFLKKKEVEINIHVYGINKNFSCAIYCCATADNLAKLLQQCFLFFIVVVKLGHNLGNSQVSVYRTIGPTLVVTAAGVVPCGSPKKRLRTSSIVQFIFYFWSF